jgi:hypothetical protein
VIAHRGVITLGASEAKSGPLKGNWKTKVIVAAFCALRTSSDAEFALRQLYTEHVEGGHWSVFLVFL